MKPSLVFAAMLLLPHLGASAQAPTVERPKAPPAAGVSVPPLTYRADGYGRLRFGMEVEQVKSLLSSDFPQASTALADETNLLTRTRTLTLALPNLAPGPGAATINCVFGATRHQLIAVNVIWLVPAVADKAQQGQLIKAAAQLASPFAQQPWPTLRTTYGRVLAPGVSVVFAGRDAAGGGVEVWLQGVALAIAAVPDKQPAATTADQDLPPGPASLRLTLVANTDHPDTYRIPAGAF